MEYVTIASTGDFTDFGDRTVAAEIFNGGSSSTRGIFAGGYGGSPAAILNIIDYITIASTGDSTDFGDLTEARQETTGVSNRIRGVWGAGGAPSNVNTMDYVTIASTGDAADFGDLQATAAQIGSCSDSHGGLQ